MLRRQGRMIHPITIIAILMTVFAVNAYAQYNGECWAADYYNVIKIDANGATTPIPGFSEPLSLSIDPTDGSVWVADTAMVRVRKLSASGQDILALDGTSTPPAFATNPRSVAVDPADSSCWVGTLYSVLKFSSAGKQLAKIEGFNEPIVAVNPLNSECWVADSSNARLVRLSAAGQQLAEKKIPGVTQPKSISINPKDGTFWVMDAFTRKVVKLSSDGQILVETIALSAGPAIMGTSLTASLDGGCWVAVMVDTMNDAVVKLSADGKELLKVDGFQMPSGLASDPKDGGCWLANTNASQVVKLSASGAIVTGIGGLTYPKVVAVALQAK